MKLIAGRAGPYKTGSSTSKADKTATVVFVEGELEQLKAQNPDQFCPPGMVVENSTVDPTSGGHGKMTIRCVNYGGSDASTIPTRITWKISMGEVQTDLKRHPHFDDEARRQIMKWLATDEFKRYDQQSAPQYVDEEGQAHPLVGSSIDYVVAYEKGIETYLRHFPVIEKISFYKRLPGCSMNENSTTSGTVSQFSNDIDTWNVPSVRLSGFADNGWFKSGDNYEQGNDTIWTRTEQWTWTPEGSGSDTGWIYRNS